MKHCACLEATFIILFVKLVFLLTTTDRSFECNEVKDVHKYIFFDIGIEEKIEETFSF